MERYAVLWATYFEFRPRLITQANPGAVGAQGWTSRTTTPLVLDSILVVSRGKDMDDVLCVYAKTDKWDSARFLEYQGTEGYMPPMILQEAGENCFLETEFEIRKDGIHHRLN